MPHYFVSDVHLHLDWPERGRNFSRFVSRLSAEDRLIIGGDLHDFWFSSRQRKDADRCEGLAALIDFQNRGGQIVLIAGNHDAYMESFYRQRLNVQFHAEPFIVECSGFNIRLLHGHLIGPIVTWKALVAGPLFHSAFAKLPDFVANRLQSKRLDVNVDTHEARCDEFFAAFRRYVQTHQSDAENEIFVFGHVHELLDEQVGTARLIVLGEWDEQINYLRIDADGATLVQE